ncbi:hypothetical protein HRI_003552600 [Hibiscus trionum]|uniref:RING-type domain-containing protein n=1 Tax=Hibiscus trionum TaxID=183268 RepID=A0A9W7IP91_HIBTR|nr:hypothetical protein HRI_003552600 [Hibiscus trionum]
MDVHDGNVAAPPSSHISCSICLDLVSHTGHRSRAKLQCGHEFHLDCIGSAFNMKGAMQCPICQKVEEGQWLYVNGSTPSLPGPSMEDRNLDDDDDGDDYEPVYSEMHVRTQWCPFGEFTRVDSSSEEVESPSTASAAQGSATGEPNASTRSGSFPHHPAFEHGSSSRVGSLSVSSGFPRHPGSEGHANGLIQTSVVFYRRPNHFNQQHFNQSRVPAPVVPGMTRGVAPAVSLPQLDQTGGVYVHPPSSSSG